MIKRYRAFFQKECNQSAQSFEFKRTDWQSVCIQPAKSCHQRTFVMKKFSAAVVVATLALMAPMPAFAHHKVGHPDFRPIRAASLAAPAKPDPMKCGDDMMKSAPEAKEKTRSCCEKGKAGATSDVLDGVAHISKPQS
ncbi:MAG: hypothetical protein H6847_09970 [Hyphomonas sp.]|jgi:hypothetical protein|nr:MULTISPECIES: hypothetical protein [Hyphomonas]MCB9960831.1 hypothetical protein [Hyphomonas sp.]MCB9971820.1 hypothetical protein [Hyphomonas sp.]